MAFLQGGETNGYAPQSGQITGILKTMGETMQTELNEAAAEEATSITNNEGLIAANNKQIEALTAAIEEKSVRVGDVSVELVHTKGDLKDTIDAIADDKAFLADLQKNCGTKEAEWAETQKLRSEEMIALADTIKMLNSDDALELFKKTLPGSASSLLQLQAESQNMRAQALAAIRTAEKKVAPGSRSLNFITLALSGKKIGFDKVLKMIDNMVVLLEKEQGDDDNKKAYCNKQFDLADDKKKGIEQALSDSEKAIEDAQEAIATSSDDIKALEAGIRALDKQVADATEQRQAENAEFKDLMTSDAAAKKLIGMAKNRLNKCNNHTLNKPPPKRELSEEDRAAQAAGEFVQEAPGPAPEAPGPYEKKTEESNGIIKMLDMMVQDLDKEMQVAEVEEKNAQEEYEQTLADAKTKRADDSKSISDKKGARADAEEALQTHTDAKAASTAELSATVEYIGSLHGECDWLLQYYDVRREARTSEIDALGKAKDVLNGASFSFVQIQKLRR